jgi:2-C-methyl-D-erythritol 4-phosphate cytidylyltransferase
LEFSGDDRAVSIVHAALAVRCSAEEFSCVSASVRPGLNSKAIRKASNEAALKHTPIAPSLLTESLRGAIGRHFAKVKVAVRQD